MFAVFDQIPCRLPVMETVKKTIVAYQIFRLPDGMTCIQYVSRCYQLIGKAAKELCREVGRRLITKSEEQVVTFLYQVDMPIQQTEFD